MSNLHNRAGMNTATAGQGTMTLSSAIGAVAINVAGFQSFATSGVADQEIVQYLILDVNGNWEVGTGTYSTSGPTLTRVVKYSNNSNTAISLSGSAQVFICALASDGFDVLGGSSNPMRGFDTPVNLQINATQNGTILTVAIKGNNGADPSPTNPVYIPFRDPTATGGGPVWRIVTAALSINTNAAGATLGTSNNTAFRFWVCAFDNAGTVVLALINCSTATAAGTANIFPLNEGAVASTTGFTASSNSAGVFYTPNATALTNKSFRILGYIEYNATGLATAGTYATSPNFIQLMGPGIRKPGEVMQIQSATTTSPVTNATNAFVSTNSTVNITPTSSANPIHITAAGPLGVNNTTQSGIASIFNGSTQLGSISGATAGINGSLFICAMEAFQLPNSISQQTYLVKIGTTGAATTYTYPGTLTVNSVAYAVAFIKTEEIMG